MQKNILLPQVELEMENVAVVKVCVRVGDHVDAERPIVEVETQKATTEVPASESGYVRKLYVKEGDTIVKEALLCVLTDTADEPFADPATPGRQTSGDEKRRNLTAAATAGAAPTGAEAAHASGIVPAAPAARRLAAERGVDLRSIRGTGPGGRVTTEDVRAAADGAAPTKPGEAREAAAAPPGGADGQWIPLPAARVALIAQMHKSLAEIPQIHVARQMDVTALARKEEGITFTHRLVRAAAAALARHPALRTVIQGDRSRAQPVSVAVAMDTPHGLFAPALRQAQTMSLAQIAQGLQDLRRRAEARSLRREELNDAPFAITNLGMMGVDFFNAFVFHGQTAVLAVARATDGPGGHKVAWFSLAVDHRAVDGAEAARFLETLQQEINRP